MRAASAKAGICHSPALPGVWFLVGFQSGESEISSNLAMKRSGPNLSRPCQAPAEPTASPPCAAAGGQLPPHPGLGQAHAHVLPPPPPPRHFWCTEEESLPLSPTAELFRRGRRALVPGSPDSAASSSRVVWLALCPWLSRRTGWWCLFSVLLFDVSGLIWETRSRVCRRAGISIPSVSQSV